MSNLAESITESMDTMVERVIKLTELNQIEDASAVLNEWTPKDECILTKYLNCQIDQVTDSLIYVTVDEDEFSYGQFTFCPDAELPIDNN